MSTTTDETTHVDEYSAEQALTEIAAERTALAAELAAVEVAIEATPTLDELVPLSRKQRDLQAGIDALDVERYERIGPEHLTSDERFAFFTLLDRDYVQNTHLPERAEHIRQLLDVLGTYRDRDVAETLQQSKIEQAREPDGFGPGIAVADATEYAVIKQLTRMRVAAEAKRRLAAEQLPPRPAPVFEPLDWRLSRPVDPVTYRVAGLWPARGNVVLSAQRKAGKTTLVGNLVRSLVDGDPFLGEPASAFESMYGQPPAHPVAPLPPGRRVALVDLEMTPAMLDQWLREQGIRNVGSVVVINLRGQTSDFNITDERCRAEWANALRLASVDVLIVDPLAPALAACGLNENEQADVNAWTQAFDALKNEAGVAEGLVVHHMGHDGERARGSSRLRDWPEAEWKIQRSESPTAPRYFSADGRDVHVAEQGLQLVGRRLTLVGGSRAENREGWEAASHAALAYVENNPGATMREIRENAGERHGPVQAAVKALVANGQLREEPEGRGKPTRHYLPGAEPGGCDDPTAARNAGVVQGGSGAV